MDEAACEESQSDTFVVSIEVLAAATLLAVLVLGVMYLRRTWAHWYATVMRQAFESIDTDGSGTIHSDELWAGVLYICIRFRQSNIPADPPEHQKVKDLMNMMDVNKDGRLNLAEFEAVMSFLSPNILARATTLFVFILTWPALAGFGCNAAADYLSDAGVGAWLPPLLRCLFSMLDTFHIAPILGALAGFVFILPRLYDWIDYLTESLASKVVLSRVVRAVDPTPLIGGERLARRESVHVSYDDEDWGVTAK